MDSYTGKSRLLVLLFFVLSWITLCLSAPTPAANFLNTVNNTGTDYAIDTLEKRGSNFNKWEQMTSDLNRAKRVDVNKEEFQGFSGGSTIFGSTGFESCVGIVVAAKEGAIIGHYNPSVNDLNRAKANIPKLFKEHQAKLSGGKAYVYASVQPYKPDQFVDASLITEAENIVKNELKMQPNVVKYTEASALAMDENDEIRDCDFEGAEMSGLVRIIGGGGKEPQVDFVTHNMQLNP